MADSINIFDEQGVPRGLLIDFKNRFVVKQSEDYSIIIGEQWYFRDYAELSGEGDKFNIHFRAPSMVGGIGTVDFRMSWRIASNAGVSVVLYASPTVTAKGSLIAVRNRNPRVLALPLEYPQYGRWYLNSSFTGGITAQRDMIGSGKENQAGQECLGEFSVPENSVYVMEFEKQASGDCWVSYEFSWREIIVGGTVQAITTTTTT